MRFPERIGVVLERVDVRAASHLVLLYGPLVAALLSGLYLFAASEFLELAHFELDERLSQLDALWSESDPQLRAAELSLLGAELERDAGGFRVVDPRGTIAMRGGRSMDEAPGEGGGYSPALSAIRLGPGDALRAERTLDSGERLEVFVSSASFVRERDEMLHAFWITLWIGVTLVALMAIPATWLSLAPLRHATRITTAIDAHSLASRLPNRGTADDVDRHARAVNRLLDQIEVGFARLQAFSQDVAHELRTPVHRILNATELRLLEGGIEGSLRSELDAIHRSADQMARMIDGLLMLARGEGDPLALRRETVDVASLGRTLAEMYGPVCDDASVRLEVDCRSAFVSGDAALLLRAVGNLLDNALAHTLARGRIRLAAGVDAADPGSVRLEVEDDGPGVPAADRDRIFDRFQRLAGADRREGVGLGLPIARAIARAHGGDVELVVSRGEGSRSGARFVLRLPRAAPPERA
ncbi:MAG: ATP-binding protein [Myxococcota bacterium]